PTQCNHLGGLLRNPVILVVCQDRGLVWRSERGRPNDSTAWSHHPESLVCHRAGEPRVERDTMHRVRGQRNPSCYLHQRNSFRLLHSLWSVERDHSDIGHRRQILSSVGPQSTEHDGRPGLGGVEKSSGPRGELLALVTRRGSFLFPEMNRFAECEIGDAISNLVLGGTVRAAKCAVDDKPVRDLPKRCHQPGIIVRVHAAQQIDRLYIHRLLTPLAVRQAKLVDVHIGGLGQRVDHRPATSSGWSISRFDGDFSPGSVRVTSFQISVSVEAGDTSEVLTPVPLSSARSTSCTARRPNLAAEYATLPLKIVRSAIEPMVTMWPRPRFFIPVRNARTKRNGATRFVLSSSVNCSTPVSSAAATLKMPALLTRMSGGPPSSEMMRVVARSTFPGSATSVAMAIDPGIRAD